MAAAVADPKTLDELYKLPVFGGPRQRRQAGRWMAALETARTLPDSELPSRRPPTTGLPPVNRWEGKDPAAAARYTAVRAGLTELAEHVDVPVENLLLPDLVRQLCWEGLPSVSTEAVAERLTAGGARPWQVELTVTGDRRGAHSATRRIAIRSAYARTPRLRPGRSCVSGASSGWAS